MGAFSATSPLPHEDANAWPIRLAHAADRHRRTGDGVTGAVHGEADEYEKRPHTRAQAVGALRESFVLMSR